MIPLVFVEVRVTSVADTPVMLLREAEGSRHLAIWISAGGGNAILTALDGPDEDHPSTHDLMVDALGAVEALIEAVHIKGVTDGIFHAEMVVNGTAITCRASDGVALALRCGAPILADEQVLDEVGVGLEAEAQPGWQGPDDQLEEFKAFLDTISPDDFGPPQGEPGQAEPEP